MVLSCKELLALINERGGMTKQEVRNACLTRDPNATHREIQLTRKRLHWNEMVVYDVSGSGRGRYTITVYGRNSLYMDDKAFEHALVN